MNKTYIVFIVLIVAAIGIYFYMKNKTKSYSVADNKQLLLSNGIKDATVSQMSEQEINDAATYLRAYLTKGSVKPSPDLVERIKIISSKYDIFT